MRMKRKSSNQHRNRIFSRPLSLLAAMALTVAIAAPAIYGTFDASTPIVGYIRNDAHEAAPFPEYMMSKILTEEEGRYALELTAGGGDTDITPGPGPVYVALVLDATSSMTGRDVTGDGSGETRWTAALTAARSYLAELFQDTLRDKYVALVSFGYGARVHYYDGGQANYPETINDPVSGNTLAARNSSPGDGKLTVNDSYVGGFRAGDGYIHAQRAVDALAEYQAITRDGTDRFFYKVRDKERDEDKAAAAALDFMLDNISQYSGTNNEAGLLLAADLLNRAAGANQPAARKYIVFLSDGEAPATSSFASLYELPPLAGANLGNVYDKTADSGFIDYLYGALRYDFAVAPPDDPYTVNPFDGNWHNVDTGVGRGGRLVTAGEMLAPARETLAAYA
ncbi:MAG: VWA domain-containing protein, partial [Peptococcaceae bacterium]|nr:VWA domain-containing protein [Peptococcaceae bacterium]